MNLTNDVLLLLLTPIVVVVLVAIYALKSAAYKILRIEAAIPKQLVSSSQAAIATPGLGGGPRHLTVLINPFSGSKKANKIFESLRPSLENAGLSMNIIETTGKGQAYRIAMQISQQDCDGIVCIGGDGTVHEVINGLLSRSDATIARHIPIAVIPTGSTNELAETLGIHTPQQAAEKLIQGLTRPLDILALTTPAPDIWLSRPLYSFQGVGWGLSSEMLSVAERLRWWVSPTPLSPLRLTLAAILTILTTLSLPRYSAKLTFLPLTLPTNNPTTIINNNPNNCNSSTNDSNIDPLQDVCAVNTAQCSGCEQPMRYNKGKRPSSDLKGWIVVDGKTDGLLFFNAANTPGKLSPHAHLSDGYMDLSLITRCSRLQLTRLLMKDDSLNIPDLTDISPSSLLSNNGYHIRQYKTAQVRLEVDRNLPVIVDGELMDPPEGVGPLTLDMEVLRGMCYVVC